jgi:hypothetical protein
LAVCLKLLKFQLERERKCSSVERERWEETNKGVNVGVKIYSGRSFDPICVYFNFRARWSLWFTTVYGTIYSY